MRLLASRWAKSSSLSPVVRYYLFWDDTARLSFLQKTTRLMMCEKKPMFLLHINFEKLNVFIETSKGNFTSDSAVLNNRADRKRFIISFWNIYVDSHQCLELDFLRHFKKTLTFSIFPQVHLHTGLTEWLSWSRERNNSCDIILEFAASYVSLTGSFWLINSNPFVSKERPLLFLADIIAAVDNLRVSKTACIYICHIKLPSYEFRCIVAQMILQEDVTSNLMNFLHPVKHFCSVFVRMCMCVCLLAFFSFNEIDLHAEILFKKWVLLFTYVFVFCDFMLWQNCFTRHRYCL